MPTALFQISDTHTRRPVPDLVFASKITAKLKRGELNEQEGKFRYYVSPGPDHRNYKGRKK